MCKSFCTSKDGSVFSRTPQAPMNPMTNKGISIRLCGFFTVRLGHMAHISRSFYLSCMTQEKGFIAKIQIVCEPVQFI